MTRVMILAAAIAAIAATALPLWANPFMSTEADDGAAITPAVRTPTSQGPMVDAQRDLRERSAEAIRRFADDPSGSALVALLAAASLYGMLHAAGPGHRKTIVFSLFLGRDSRPWEPLAAGFLAAGVHAGVGAALVGLLSLAYGAIAGLGDTERAAAWLEASTFGALILLSALLTALKLRALAKGGSHRHGGADARGLYGLVAVTSLVPCPGATMILLFALYAGMPGLGVAAVVAMSIGMGTVISAAGYLAYAGREGVFRRIKARERTVGLLSDALELCSYLIVLGFSLYMAWPAVTGLLQRLLP